VIPLTSAECLEIAERKIGEAIGDRRYGNELRATAQAWLVLAEKVEQAKRLEARVVQDSPCAPDPKHGPALFLGGF
jgi:ABC-type phosphonate transport system ATPase subunit